jgi:hypothetical protein
MTIELKKKFTIVYPDGRNVKAVFSYYDKLTRRIIEKYIDGNGICQSKSYMLMMTELDSINETKYNIQYNIEYIYGTTNQRFS